MRIMRFYNVIHYALWEHLVLAKCELEISRLDSGFKYIFIYCRAKKTTTT